ncbi:hypothetical protein DSO57_1031014 [Entomophthora muscae]|uniref:Uncharacterized protein n=1 Tax=Entomophthora muscae TaxID=34485 RepID=A0ACC2TBN6_9FUNG|nr:hypothetical protein DSO57_1031014 [Entomophthora muscae]
MKFTSAVCFLFTVASSLAIMGNACGPVNIGTQVLRRSLGVAPAKLGLVLSNHNNPSPKAPAEIKPGSTKSNIAAKSDSRQAFIGDLEKLDVKPSKKPTEVNL